MADWSPGTVRAGFEPPRHPRTTDPGPAPHPARSSRKPWVDPRARVENRRRI